MAVQMLIPDGVSYRDIINFFHTEYRKLNPSEEDLHPYDGLFKGARSCVAGKYIWLSNATVRAVVRETKDTYPYTLTITYPLRQKDIGEL